MSPVLAGDTSLPTVFNYQGRVSSFIPARITDIRKCPDAASDNYLLPFSPALNLDMIILEVEYYSASATTNAHQVNHAVLFVIIGRIADPADR
jgi:hypothetical protein